MEIKAIPASPAMAFASVRTEDFRFVAGKSLVRRFQSTGFGHRLFCGACGTLVQMRVDHQPETVDFPIPTLDDPAAVAPAFHIFHSSRIDWFETADDLPRHARFRPGTRGLEGTKPPS